MMQSIPILVMQIFILLFICLMICLPIIYLIWRRRIKKIQLKADELESNNKIPKGGDIEDVRKEKKRNFEETRRQYGGGKRSRRGGGIDREFGYRRRESGRESGTSTNSEDERTPTGIDSSEIKKPIEGRPRVQIQPTEDNGQSESDNGTTERESDEDWEDFS